MLIQSTRAYMGHRAAAKSQPGPDEVPPEFPGFRQSPGGPDDVYDPDHRGRSDNNGGYGGPFMESGGDSGGCGGFLG